jgi:energy-converting hydrogenase Eha subunit B
MPEHINIPESGLHEPKGASTASGDTTYVSNGSGSGSWKKVDANTLSGTLTNTTAAGRLVTTSGAGALGSRSGTFTADEITYLGNTLTAKLEEFEARITALEP